MTDQPEKAAADDSPSGPQAADDASPAALLPQLHMMWGALIASPVRNTLLALWAAIFLVVAATAYAQIRLNRWNQPFYDALSHHQLGQFLYQLGVFGVIAGVLLVLNVSQQWLTQMLSLKLRQGLAQDLIDNWLEGRRAFRLAHAGSIGVNPDQRLHEDARHLTELSATLGIGLLQASLLLAMFVAVLWSISSRFTLPLAGHELTIPGYLVWAAAFYALSASLLSYWVGHGLVDANAARYAREADLRFTLVRINEHIDAISLVGGEADEARRLRVDLNATLQAMRRLVTGLTNLTWVTAGYGWFTIIAPIVAAAPLYFMGRLSFGGLMMAAGAFTQVQSSLRWFVDNFSTIADWQATLLRVATFRRAVLDTDRLHAVAARIALVDGPAGHLKLEQLEISSPAGCSLLKEREVEIKAGERVLIVGGPGSGKTLLFRTLAGLWPWGSGRITRPGGEQMVFLPRRSYLPPGTLRELLAYPLAVDHFDRAAYGHALKRCGLERLVARLDESDRWDRTFSDEEEFALSFARVLLQAPPWLIIDELFDGLDAATLERTLELFKTELPRTAVVHIGSSFKHHPMFPTVLHLQSDPAARRLPSTAAIAA
jgi:putative ATP-binding cassette transporter